MPDQDPVLTDLRIAVAELRGEVRHIRELLDEAVVSRRDLQIQLAPLMESMNRGKGALAAATFIAGAIGATIATFIKQVFGVAPT